MIIERLQAFRRRSGVLPKRMIVFRDGVSEVNVFPPPLVARTNAEIPF